eukprot:CAMPEP_0203760140 /NCGR_PEP_ID=MMETSP0098-20131031/13504_1 /ASSEMBLY_ACC=CAM_ASM_000208 /TAXON_ID=96639 /ORGANISM=" , Strain NY0313808BC1" /LENGTH=264 /DNA_ID=CAMNT_0050653597 /DNA_START=122 /DNA_END=916 /DNA_ORIENTATION=+
MCGFSGLTALGGNYMRGFASTAAETVNKQSLLALKQPVKLYQYDVCPFCNKVQAFLEYHNVPYEKIEVNPLTKEQIKFSDYKMVPFAVINGEQVNGSSNIIETLLQQDTPSESEKEWCQWVDDHLVHILPPNIYRTPGEALQSFDYITANSNFTWFQSVSIRYAGAAVMYMIAKRSKKKYNLSDDPRQDLYDAISTWTEKGLNGNTFHSGGSEPDTADLAVFGVLRSIEGNYGTWKELEEHDMASKDAFFGWYWKMKKLVSTEE